MKRSSPVLPWGPRLRHLWIRSRWQRWFFPLVCAIPYGLSLIWLLQRGQLWIAQVLLAPLLMGVAIALLTLVLARCEDGRGTWFR